MLSDLKFHAWLNSHCFDFDSVERNTNSGNIKKSVTVKVIASGGLLVCTDDYFSCYNQEKFMLRHYIEPGSIKIQELSGAEFTLLNFSFEQPFIKTWTYTTSSQRFLKFTFLHISISPPIDVQNRTCSNHISVYDGANLFTPRLLSRFCGSNYENHPVVISPTNISTIAYSSNILPNHETFSVYIESITIDLIPKSTFACNSVFALTNETAFIYPPLFPSTHEEQTRCRTSFTLPKHDHLQGYAELHFLSISIKPKYRQNTETCIHKLQVFSSETTTSRYPALAHELCGFSPLQRPLLFSSDFEIALTADREHMHQGFFATITVKYCLNGMEYRKRFCKHARVISCDSRSILPPKTKLLEPSCFNDCTCPRNKPFWNSRCLSVVECKTLLSNEAVEKTSKETVALDRRKKRQAGSVVSSYIVGAGAARPTRGVFVLCGDRSGSISYCALQKSLGHCRLQSIIDHCRSTCGMCTPPTSWSSWSTYSRCGGECIRGRGRRMRHQSCLNCGIIKVQVQECHHPTCVVDLADLRHELGTSSAYVPQEMAFDCDDDAFICANRMQCVKSSQKCDGYYDCSDESDEPGDCTLGLRFDGLLVIMNWPTHNCLDTTQNQFGRLVPWGHRKCPGPGSHLLSRYWWEYIGSDYGEPGGLLRHYSSRLCLTAVVEKPTVTQKTTSVATLHMAACDPSFRTRAQLWECEPGSFRVMLKYPDEVLPEALRSKHYLALSVTGPGMHLNLTDEFSEQTTDFHIYYTDRKNICTKRTLSELPYLLPRGICSKSCGSGVVQVLRQCARYGRMTCPDGRNYDMVPCNTHPCSTFCQPGWSLMSSKENEKVGCFKLFSEPKTFEDAQSFCAARNWTLASDKNRRSHEVLLDLLNRIERAYIGIYEDRLETSEFETPSAHPLVYTFDQQPVGAFQPWVQYYNSTGHSTAGCALGVGAGYYGSLATDRRGVACGTWSGKGFNPLPDLEQPYFNSSNAGNPCRNPSLSGGGPWCYTEQSTVSHCDVPDCLNITSTRFLSGTDPEHVFLIQSHYGRYWERKYCLSDLAVRNSSGPKYAELRPCAPDDGMQQFFWWGRYHLVNRGSRSCLSIEHGPPEHGGRLIFERCERLRSHTSQGWIGRGDFLFSAWGSERGVVGAKESLLKVVHDVTTAKALLVDLRRSLFVAWTKRLGTHSLAGLLSRTPAGPYVHVRGCGMCLTHDPNKGYNLVFSEACSQHSTSQRWVILTQRHLMNVGSGMCLASLATPGYAVMHRCAHDDGAQLWEWKESITHTMTVIDRSTMRHEQTGLYLHCDCTGTSSICTVPVAADSSSVWEFVPPVTSNAENRANTESRATVGGVLGYPFLLQSTLNLTHCAKPEIRAEQLASGNLEQLRIEILLVPCRTTDSAFLWWFSGQVTQIKHRNLDLCLDAETSLTENQKGSNETEVFLKPCSLSRIDYQSWVFIEGPSLRGGNELPGDYVRLASDNRYYLTLKPLINDPDLSSTDRFVLAMKGEDDTDRWDAFVSRGFTVEISEMRDCAQGWTRMTDYRGSRSWTRTGIRCQPWKSQTPHRHPFVPRKFLNFELNQNECRRPPGPPSDYLDSRNEDFAWCMALHPDTEWQECRVSRCPSTVAVTLLRSTRSWDAVSGNGRYPFLCQSSGECYYGNGLDFTGETNWTGRATCLNWRKHYGGNRAWPDHNQCLNPTPSLSRPWCWVAPDVMQYCSTLHPCPKRCPSPYPLLHNMKIASISYSVSSQLYAVGSRVQVICKPGYNVSLPDDRRDQIIFCTEDGNWRPHLIPCSKVFCPKPTDFDNAILLTSHALYGYGSVAAYECEPGAMIAPGRILAEVTCLENGQWSEAEFKCERSCPPGWISYRFSCYLASWNPHVYRDYAEALATCNRTAGTLAVPRNEMEYHFLRHLVTKASGGAGDPFWLGLHDIAASASKPAARRWDAIADFKAIYLNRMIDYQQFKIRNFGAAYRNQEKFIYTDRCMYGDRASRRVYMKSCFFENDEGLYWTWLTHDHLYNVDLDLCLSASRFDLSGSYRFSKPDTVSLERCDLNSTRQRFICGPHSAFLLKSREVESTFLTIDEREKSGEVRVAGSHVTGPLSLWHAVPGGQYLCHWDLKPPDTYFIVHRGLSPTATSFTRYELDKCLTNQTGATLARLPVTSGARDPVFEDEYPNWCDCLFMLDDVEGNDVVAASLIQKDVCARPDTNVTSYAAVSGISPCTMTLQGDSLCTRNDGTSPSVKAVPNWCGTLSVPQRYLHFMSPRTCNSRLRGSICETSARWSCDPPIIPEGAKPLSSTGLYVDVQYAYGSNVTLQCEKGHRFPVSSSSTITIACNHNLRWEVINLYPEDDVRSFIQNTLEREKAAVQLGCNPVVCPTPRIIPGLVWTAIGGRNEAGYNYGAKGVFSCSPGTEFAFGNNTYPVTCTEDASWQPALDADTKCQTVRCHAPPILPNSFLDYSDFGFDSEAQYTCAPGYWFNVNSFVFVATCNASGLWQPDPLLVSCIRLSCRTPNSTELSGIGARIVTERLLYYHGDQMILKCQKGYWFDKSQVGQTFTCDGRGRWQPVSPHALKCRRVRCSDPQQIPGAVRIGSDRTAGAIIEYRCSAFHWVRPVFKIFSPHWGLCISVEGGPDPEFDTPLQRKPTVVDPPTALLVDNCRNESNKRNLWVWHWSYHLKNRVTDLCLTALAVPSFTQQFTGTSVQKCDRDNELQHWECAFPTQGGNARMLSLRTRDHVAYLTTLTDDSAFWSGRLPVSLVLTGNATAVDVTSLWQVYGASNSEDVNICLLREGHAFQRTTCSEEGYWIPHPSEIECTLVDCGPPPMIEHGSFTVDDQVFIDLDANQFAAPNMWEHRDGWSSGVASNYPVASAVTYNCDRRISGNFSVSIMCRENGLWQNLITRNYLTNYEELEYLHICQSVTCPLPAVDLTSYARIYPSQTPKFFQGKRVQNFNGYLTYSLGMNISFDVSVETRATVACIEGYWVPRSQVRNVPRRVRYFDAYGTPYVTSWCREDGTWSEPIFTDGFNCTPVFCRDPGQINYARRYPGRMETSPPFGSIIHYRCQQGYRFSPVRVYTDIICNEYGVWAPDPRLLSCVPSTCNRPANVPFAVRTGDSFTVGSEITYACLPGHFLCNNLVSTTSTCRSDGTWFPPPSTIQCILLECFPLPVIAHSSLDNLVRKYSDVFVPGDRVTLTCDEGFVLNTGDVAAFLHCGSNGAWSVDSNRMRSDEIHCSRVHCPVPSPRLASGAVLFSSANSYQFGDVIRYICPVGKVTTDGTVSAESTCVVRRSINPVTFAALHTVFWNPDLTSLTCQMLSCPHPGIKAHANLTISGMTYLSTSTYTCFPGYQVDSPFTDRFAITFVTTCGDDARWRPDPSGVTCRAVICPDPGPAKPPLTIVSGGSRGLYYYHDYVVYQCPPNHHFFGVDNSGKQLPSQLRWTITCQYDGTWNQDPHNSPFLCEAATCEAPLHIPFSASSYFYTNIIVPGTYPVNAFFNITCLKGYVNSWDGMPSISLRCTNTGNWYPGDPFLIRCVRIHCHDPGERGNSSRVTDGFLSGNQIRYIGNPGFVSAGISPWGIPVRIVTLECNQTGKWRVLFARQLTEEGKIGQSVFIETTATGELESTKFFEENITFVPIFCSTPNLTANVIPLNLSADATPNATPNATSNATAIVTNATTNTNATANTNATNLRKWPFESQLTLQCIPAFSTGVGTSNRVITCTERGEWFPDPGSVVCVDQTDIFCSLPPPPTRGIIEKSPSRWDSAVAVCYPGYELRSGVTRMPMNCTADGTWSVDSRNLTCNPITCTAAPTVQNANRTVSGNQYGDTAAYVCNRGRGFGGKVNETTLFSICVSSGAWDPNPAAQTCDPINCGPPPTVSMVPNTVNVTVNATVSGSVASYRCANNYTYIDESGVASTSVPAMCHEDGQWRFSDWNFTLGLHRDRMCSPLRCGQLPNISNALITYSSGTIYNAVVEYRCDTGYRSNPAPSVNTTHTNTTFTLCCAADGWISELTPATNLYSCTRLACPSLPTNKTNAVLTPPTGGGLSFGSIATMACSTGFTTVFGPSVRVECMWYGDWAPDFDLLNCVSVNCPPPPTLNYTTTSGGLTIGGTFTYNCIQGYEVWFSNTTTRTSFSIQCRSPGVWYPHYDLLSSCRRVACPVPSSIPAATIITTSDGRSVNITDRSFYIPSGVQLIFTCKENMYVRRTRSRVQKITCTDRKVYNPTLSTVTGCTEVSCSAPPKIKKAAASGGASSYKLGDVVSYLCPPNMFVRNLRLRRVDVQCTINGTFQPNVTGLECVDVSCNAVAFEYGDVISLSGTRLGDELVVRCREGSWIRRGVTQQTHVCDEDGQWNPYFVDTACRLIRCPFPSIPNVRNTTLYVEVGVDEVILCDDGYELTRGPRSLMCTQTGELYPPPLSFVCSQKQCPTPRLNPFVDTRSRNFGLGSEVELNCFPGHWLIPGVFSTKIVCLEDKRWSVDPSKIICTEVQCGFPPLPERSVLRSNSTSFGSVAVITCEPGYWLAGILKQSIAVTCDRYGSWRPTLPTHCVRITCDTPVSASYSSMTYRGTDYHATATYLCYPLYWIAHNNGTHWALTGEKQLKSECGVTGTWSPHPDQHFRCSSILRGDLRLNTPVPAVSMRRDILRNTSFISTDTIRKVFRSARAKWLRFDGTTMVISDSYLEDQYHRLDARRDPRFAWDANPLSVWQPAMANSEGRVNWALDIHFGRAQNLYAVMLMTADDGRTDVTSFSLIVAGRDKRFSVLGPFRVYGDSGIVGNARSDFLLNYSSVATAWVFDDIAVEVLWLHVIILGTVADDVQPSVREIGFFTSDAFVDSSVPIDPAPTSYLTIVLSALFLLLTVVVAFVERRYNELLLFTPPDVDRQRKKGDLYKIETCVVIYNRPRPSINLLLRLHSGVKATNLPIAWIRGNDHERLFRRQHNYFSVVMELPGLEKIKKPKIDVVGWRVIEDPKVGYTRIVNPEKDPMRIEIAGVYIVNLSTNERWTSIHEFKPAWYGNEMVRFKLDLRKTCSIALSRFREEGLAKSSVAKLFRCHNLVALFRKPDHSKLNRTDRFFITYLYLIATMVATLNSQIYFGLLPAADNLAPSISPSPITDFLLGKRSYLALSLIGCFVCLPLSLMLRSMYFVSKYITEKQDSSGSTRYSFCSHEVFFTPKVLRVPFMKILCRPLTSLLNVILHPGTQMDEWAIIHAFPKHIKAFLPRDPAVQRAWSAPELSQIEQNREYFLKVLGDSKLKPLAPFMRRSLSQPMSQPMVYLARRSISDTLISSISFAVGLRGNEVFIPPLPKKVSVEIIEPCESSSSSSTASFPLDMLRKFALQFRRSSSSSSSSTSSSASEEDTILSYLLSSTSSSCTSSSETSSSSSTCSSSMSLHRLISMSSSPSPCSDSESASLVVFTRPLPWDEGAGQCRESASSSTSSTSKSATTMLVDLLLSSSSTTTSSSDSSTVDILLHPDDIRTLYRSLSVSDLPVSEYIIIDPPVIEEELGRELSPFWEDSPTESGSFHTALSDEGLKKAKAFIDFGLQGARSHHGYSTASFDTAHLCQPGGKTCCFPHTDSITTDVRSRWPFADDRSSGDVDTLRDEEISASFQPSWHEGAPHLYGWDAAEWEARTGMSAFEPPRPPIVPVIVPGKHEITPFVPSQSHLNIQQYPQHPSYPSKMHIDQDSESYESGSYESGSYEANPMQPQSPKPGFFGSIRRSYGSKLPPIKSPGLVGKFRNFMSRFSQRLSGKSKSKHDEDVERGKLAVGNAEYLGPYAESGWSRDGSFDSSEDLTRKRAPGPSGYLPGTPFPSAFDGKKRKSKAFHSHSSRAKSARMSRSGRSSPYSGRASGKYNRRFKSDSMLRSPKKKIDRHALEKKESMTFFPKHTTTTTTFLAARKASPVPSKIDFEIGESKWQFGDMFSRVKCKLLGSDLAGEKDIYAHSADLLETERIGAEGQSATGLLNALNEDVIVKEFDSAPVYRPSPHGCQGNPRLHHTIVTHASYYKSMCPCNCRTLLNFFLFFGIVSLLMYFFWMGQNVRSDASDQVYLGAFFSFLFTLVVVLTFDAAIGWRVFHEL